MPSAEDVSRHFDWRYNQLAKLKLLQANKEMRKEIEGETRIINQKNARNLNSAINIIQILDMELRRIDEWANTNYLIYCDLWKLKGKEKSAIFVRAIYGSIRKLIRVRGSSVAHHTETLVRRTRNPNARPHIESFKRRVKNLDTKWRDKIEIEALDLEARHGQDAAPSSQFAQPRPSFPKSDGKNTAIRRTVAPRKKVDLSRFLDAARLTEKQYQCASLKWEYGFSISEISRKLDRTRKTVDDHLGAAQKKMRSSGQYEQVKRKLARAHPGE